MLSLLRTSPLLLPLLLVTPLTPGFRVAPDLLSPNECCEVILLDESTKDKSIHSSQGDRLGFYSQLGHYGGRPAYRQQGGNVFLFYLEQKHRWVDSKYFFGASLFSRLENNMSGRCLEHEDSWSYLNGSQVVSTSLLMAACQTPEEVCCTTVELLSDNSGNKSFYSEEPLASLGRYTSVGMNNGRYMYQMEGHVDRFLEYGDKYWLANTGVGKRSGHLHHDGGSVCPEHVSRDGWQVSGQNKYGDWVWFDDPLLTVSCVEDQQPLQQAHHQGRHSPEQLGEEMVHQLEQQHGGHRSWHKKEVGGGGGVVVLGLFTDLSAFLMALMVFFFAKRFHRAWGKGAHGKQLLKETFDAE